MVVMKIRRTYKHLQRYRQILSVLIRYGLAEGLERLHLDFAQDILSKPIGEEVMGLSYEERVRTALAELGPTFIKLGQILSVRPDLVGVKLSQELKSLQADVPSDDFEYVKATIEEELGREITELFTEFDPEPLASASIGQTHRATLPGGRQVVVKVRHKGIEPKVQVDLEILLDLAELLERNVEESRNYRPRDFVEQFRQALLREMDFRHEMRNLEQFRTLFEEQAEVRIPEPIVTHSARKVLSMEFFDGVHASDLDGIRALGGDPVEVALRGGHLYLKMVFVYGRFHADPHPGNILVLPGGTIGLLDFGTVGRLTDELREDLEDLIIALAQRQGERATDIIVRVGTPPRDLDVGMLRTELMDLTGYYVTKALSEIDVGQLLTEVMDLIQRHHIVLPPAISMLIKVLITLEGTGRALSPEFNLAELLEPYKTQVILRRLSPERQMKKMQRLYRDLERAAQVVPTGLVDIVAQLRKGDFRVQLEHQGLQELGLELRYSANCLTLGILTAALFLGSTVLLSAKVPPLVFGQSLFGLLGYVLAVLFGVRLLWAVRHLGLAGWKR